MRAAGRPALEPLRAPYKFELRTVPAGTKQVLHDVQYGAPDVAERAGLRYGVSSWMWACVLVLSANGTLLRFTAPIILRAMTGP